MASLGSRLLIHAETFTYQKISRTEYKDVMEDTIY